MVCCFAAVTWCVQSMGTVEMSRVFLLHFVDILYFVDTYCLYFICYLCVFVILDVADIVSCLFLLMLFGVACSGGVCDLRDGVACATSLLSSGRLSRSVSVRAVMLRLFELSRLFLYIFSQTIVY